MPQWFLASVEVSGGFLAGLNLQLPLGLTCVIGPRGSGKSTLVEAIRYCLAGAVTAPKSRSELIQANLAQAVITVRTAGKNEEPGYLIRRASRQPPSLMTSDGVAVASVDLDRGTFLPIDAYSSAEIEAIADESLGEKRRALLDELNGEELERIHFSLGEKRRRLEANADSIHSAERQIADLTERIEELSGARARLHALPQSAASKVSEPLLKASQQQQFNQQEASMLAGNQQQAETLAADLSAMANRLRNTPRRGWSVESQNKDLIEEGTRILDATTNEVADQVASDAQRLLAACESLQSVRNRLSAIHEEQAARYVALQAENQAVGQAIQERRDAEQAVSELEKLEVQRVQARDTLTDLREARKGLKAEFLLERERISKLRQDVARSLQADAGGKVRIRVVKNADNSAYRAMLLDALKGARVRNHDEILDCVMRLRPEQLAQIIADNDLPEFETHTSLGNERCRRILEAYKSSIDPLPLEIIPIDDRVSIELNVSNTAEPLFKDASELSRGQKCTALLPLLLARCNTPLLIDQPEDNLDNHFIFETVVESIRRQKGRRQMIFVTHNANIPVLAEADLIVVLNSDGKRGIVEQIGSLDECREQIIELLEGGRQAFELRRQRYQVRTT